MSVILLAVGVATARWPYFALAAITALPFLLYLAATPRFSFMAPVAGASCIASVVSAWRRRTALAAFLFVPFLILAGVVAFLVIRQPVA